MTPAAAKELTDLIMLDDFVERRAALKRWEERWTVTADLAQYVRKDDKSDIRDATKGLAEDLLNSMLRGDVPVLDANLMKEPDGRLFVRLVAHMIRLKPR